VCAFQRLDVPIAPIVMKIKKMRQAPAGVLASCACVCVLSDARTKTWKGGAKSILFN
jgi:hypothetical protein